MTDPGTLSRTENLGRLLNPRHVCVVGGQDAATVIRECRRIGYQGQIWPVNPKRAEIEGIPCFRDVTGLPEPPDATFLAIPPAPALDVVSTLNTQGAGGVVCYTAGFGQTGQEGGDADLPLAEAAGNLAVIGPNCYGMINYLDKVALWPFEHGGYAPGFGAAIITQSGMLSSDITMNQRSVPLAFMVSAGNQSVLTIPDYISALCERDEVRAIGLHIEGLRNVQAFVNAVEKSLELNKPVVVLKSGNSKIGSALTMSHTGSSSGQESAYRALFDKLGIISVDNPSGLLETLKLLCTTRRPAGTKLCAFTCSGGGATLVADYSDKIGLTLVEPNANTTLKLQELLPSIATVSNPLDYTTPIWGQYEKTAPVFDTVLTPSNTPGDQRPDIALLVQDYPLPEINDSRQYYINDATAFADACRKARLPAVVCSTLPENLDQRTREYLIERGVAPLQGIHEALDAIRLVAKSEMINVSRRKGSRFSLQLSAEKSGTEFLANEETIGVRQVDEGSAKKLMSGFGIAVPAGVVTEPGGVSTQAESLGYPVVLKLNSDAIAHKSELGLVRLNLQNDAELREAASCMLESARSAEGVEDKPVFLLEQMMSRPVAELVVAVRYDPAFGWLATIGSGGVLVDLLDDTVTLVLPAEREELHRAFDQLRIRRLLDGYRGAEPADCERLVDTLHNFFVAVSGKADTVAEIEINPLFVYPQSVCAVDVLMYKTCGQGVSGE